MANQIILNNPLLPSEQLKIRERCYHPSKTFINFRESAINQSIPARFEEQVNLYNNRIAVKTLQSTFMYGELNLFANRIANNILSYRGKGPESIGILLEMDWEVISAILGVLKTGKYFVTLDPLFPKKRISYMLADSQPSLIITNSTHFELAQELIENDSQIIINIDDLPIDLSIENPEVVVHPDDIAYIIYTSGSTGQPKGIVYNHISLLVGIKNYTNAFHICYLDKLTLLHSPSFSSAMVDIFCALLNGATLYPWDIKSIGLTDLGDWLIQEGITIFDWIPSPYRYFIDSLKNDMDFPDLRILILASEPVLSSDVDLYRSYFSDNCILVNRLGSTETFNYRLFFINKETILNKDKVPAGYPVPDKRIIIIDDSGQEIGGTQVGEIAVKSQYLAMGYWNLPELTEKVFLSDPNGSKERTFLTGDLGIMHPNGCLEYLGRKDFQVKIRGFRIEVNEIERNLVDLDYIKEAAVVAVDDNSGEKSLAAYLVPSDDYLPTRTEVREALTENLPDYLIPKDFQFLESLPLTPTGKLDRLALPQPIGKDMENNRSYQSPRTPEEKNLADIWSEVLKVGKIGINDNFFELGGHSLLATQITARILDDFKVKISVISIFNNPTINELAGFIDRVIDDKVQVDDQIFHVPRNRNLPLSYGQERIWFLQELELASPVYNLPSSFKLHGPLDINILQKSFNEIINRHEILRTSISIIEGQPTQFINQNLTISIPIIDLSDLNDLEKSREVDKLILKDSEKAFDLSDPPLIRIKIIQLKPNENVLFINFHHIVTDGWSMRILYEELSTLYENYLQNKPSPLPGLEYQYVDFSQWQRKWMTLDLQKSQLNYWNKQLAQSSPLLNLPFDSPRTTIKNYRGEKHSFKIPTHISIALKDLSHKENVTFFMTLLSAYSLLLHRQSGQFDITIGVPIANRYRIEFEKLIGFFLNTIVLRTDLTGNPSFIDYLQRIKKIALEAYENQDIPFEKLLEFLQPDRDPSHTPLFQTWFVYQEYPRQPLKLANLDVNRYFINTDTAMFDLSLSILDTDEELIGTFSFNSDVFSKATIIRFVEQFQALLESIKKNPEEKISNIELISEYEKSKNIPPQPKIYNDRPQIEFGLAELNNSIISRFEKQVNMYPDNIAIKNGNQTTTYQALQIHANNISNELILKSHTGNGVVALLFEHGSSMIAGMFGALKAGKTYVALDPNYPIERLKYLIKDSQADILLSNDRNSQLSNKLIIDDILLLNIDQIELSDSKDLTPTGISPSSYAYILYTSGSLGNPKGVIQNHRNVLTHIRNYTNNLRIEKSDKVLLLASYSFDAAIMDIFGALLNGATLIPYDIKNNSLDDLQNFINTEEVTIYHSTPTVYRYFMDSLSEKKSFPSVRFVVLGGEEVIRSDFECYKKHFEPDCIFINGFGPTESTICTQFIADHGTEIKRNSIPIGFPVDGIEILLLDEEGHDTKVFGEISIRSSQIALGYWNKPDLTKKSFFTHSDGNRKRIYKTGDLGFRSPDGNLFFMGRKDNQLKVRGYRIEPREVESQLNKHPKVKDSSVLATQSNNGEKILTAYYVPDIETSLELNNLRGFLSERLPEYMIPSKFISIDKMPLTPTGKIDRLALPAPDFSTTDFDRSYISPQTDLEKVLANIWSQILETEQVGLHDNFFDLGGHSLLAVRLVSIIKEKTGKDFPLMKIYQAPTINNQAEYLKQQGISLIVPNSSIVRILSGNDSNPPFFCIPGNLGNVFTDLKDLANGFGPDQPFFGFQDGIHNPIYIENVAKHYINQLREVQPEGPYYLGGLCSGGMVAFEMAQELQAQGQEVALLVMVEPPRPRIPGSRSVFRFISTIFRRFFNRVGPQTRKFSDLSFSEKRFYLLLKLKLLANTWANNRYTPKPYIGKIHLFLANETTNSTRSKQLLWENYALGGSELHDIPGTHDQIVGANDTLIEPEYMEVLAKLIKPIIEEQRS